MNKTRPLTKREQLEWYINFLYEKKEEINREIESAEIELKLVKREGEC